MKALLVGIVATLVMLAAPVSTVRAQAAGSGASADEPDKKAEAKKGQAPKVKVERGAGGRKVFRITTGFVIEGRIQKPNAFYVLQRSQINYDWARLKKDFMPRILDAVDEHPF